MRRKKIKTKEKQKQNKYYYFFVDFFLYENNNKNRWDVSTCPEKCTEAHTHTRHTQHNAQPNIHKMYSCKALVGLLWRRLFVICLARRFAMQLLRYEIWIFLMRLPIFELISTSKKKKIGGQNVDGHGDGNVRCLHEIRFERKWYDSEPKISIRINIYWYKLHLGDFVSFRDLFFFSRRFSHSTHFFECVFTDYGLWCMNAIFCIKSNVAGWTIKKSFCEFHVHN